MTQQQLKDLIINSLGPIVDQAIRTGPYEGFSAGISEWVALKALLDAATIDQATFNARVSKMLLSWTHVRRLKFYIALARHNGDLPAQGTTYLTGDSEWPNSDWASIVAA